MEILGNRLFQVQGSQTVVQTQLVVPESPLVLTQRLLSAINVYYMSLFMYRVSQSETQMN